MVAACFFVMHNQSGNPVDFHGIGLTLSYSF